MVLEPEALEDDGVALEPLAAPAVSDDVELEVPLPFVASSCRQSSFAAPVIASQRGELPYELDGELLWEESLDAPLDDEPYVEDCANSAVGKASAITIAAILYFMDISL